MKKKLLIGLVCLLLVCGCGDVKLKDGENAVVTFKEGGISSDDLYKQLKSLYGGEQVVNLIDKYLLDKKYETDGDEDKYVRQTVKQVEKSASEAGVSLKVYLNAYYGYSDVDAFKEYLHLNYKRDLWKTDYAKETVNEKQINEYYETKVFGDVEASDILITVHATDESTDEEKKAAEEEALNTAKEVIEKLKKGEDFATLAKEYSKDPKTNKNGGSLGKVNDGQVEAEVLDALRDMKDGSYSKTPIKASDGYHVVYRTSMDEKKELDDELTELIRATIGKEIEDTDGFAAKSLKALREENEMSIKDEELNSYYEDNYK